jgi:hypothetical protein
MVMPAGANAVRAGPEKATPSVAGPGERQTSVESPPCSTHTAYSSGPA